MGTVLPFVPTLRRLAIDEFQLALDRSTGRALDTLSLLERLVLSVRIARGAR